MILIRCATALALLLAATGRAEATEEDFQAWGAATATISASDRLVVWLEGQGRFSDDANRLGQLLLRTGLGYRLNPTTIAYFGYAYVATDPVGPAETTEHRIWQQLSFRAMGDDKGITLTGRSRFEQRLIEGSDDMGFRFRQLLRLTAPLTGKARIVGWSEAFLAIDDTGWGQRGGFDRLRSFGGVSVPIGKGFALEPGYMNEYVSRVGEDRVNHIASVTVNTSF